MFKPCVQLEHKNDKDDTQDDSIVGHLLTTMFKPCVHLEHKHDKERQPG